MDGVDLTESIRLSDALPQNNHSGLTIFPTLLRRFFKDAAVYGLSTVLSRSIGLLLLPILTRYLSPADYGVVEILAVAFALVNLILPLEITQGLARLFPEAKLARQQQAYAWTAFWFTAAAFAVLVAVVWAMPGAVATALLGSSSHEALVRIAVVAMLCQALLYVVQNQLRWSLQPVALSVLNFFYAVIAALNTVVFVIVLGRGLVGYVVAQMVAGCATLMLGIWLANKRVPIRFRIDTGKLREMLIFSWPLVLSSAAVYANLYIDRWLVRYWLGFDDLGIYSVAYRIAGVVGVTIIGFQLALTPMIYRHHKEPATPVFVKRAFEYFLVFALPGVAFMGALSGEIVALVSGPGFAEAAELLGWLALATVLMSAYIFAPGLGIARKTKRIAVVNLCASAVNIAFSATAIPLIGRLGAALGFLAGASTMAMLYFILGYREYAVPYRARYYFAALGLVACFLILTSAADIPAAWRLLLWILLSVIIIRLIVDREDRRIVITRLISFVTRRS